MNVHRPQFSFEPDDAGEPDGHDMACPVCRTNHAVFLPVTGIFVPCVPCLADGWELVRWRTPLGRWRARYRSYRAEHYRRPRRAARPYPPPGQNLSSSLVRRVL